MFKHLAVGVAAALTTVGLVTSTLPAGATSSPSGEAGAGWLADELDEYGPFPYPGSEDLDAGVSIDAGIALHYGGRASRAAALRDEIEPQIDRYIAGEWFGDTGSAYANALAKTLSFVALTGGDPRDYDGVDLVARLESLVSDTAPVGRVEDVSMYGDTANVIGAGFAADALHAVGSPAAAAVTADVLRQQCADGHFPLDFRDPGADTCASDSGSVDVTALVALGLRSQADVPAVATALRQAAAYTLSQQRADGSMAGAPPTDTPNANTTGLGAWLLGATCQLGPAYRAAAWTRTLQVPAGETGTPLAAEAGAIAYDAAALARGRENGIGDSSATRDQWRRTTAQAAVGIAWQGDGTPNVTLTGPSGFQRAGARATYVVRGRTADELLPCFTAPDGPRMLTGDRVTVTLPTRTATVRYGATSGPRQSFVVVRTLAPRRLVTRVRPQVRRGGRQLVQVSGLAAGETVVVGYRGKRVALGKAGSRGRYARYVPVGVGTGRRVVTVRGQFATRRGAAAFRVVR